MSSEILEDFDQISFEPWRTKVVEPLGFTTREERQILLKETAYNLFRIPANKILIDLLTDSGTSAMSSVQWSAMFASSEAYAGSNAFYAFEKTVHEITKMPYIMPVHQGRGAEKIIFSILGGEGKTIPGNTHFDTTRANIEMSGANATDLPIPEASQHTVYHPFKGNINIEALKDLIETVGPSKIPCCIVTITNNSVGGQPVSLANLRATRDLLSKHGIPLILDAARFAENAWFISQREAEYKNASILSIAQELFSLADGAVMSTKKDGLVNVGAFIALRDETLYKRAKEFLILWEGFPTYGGLAARDLAAISQGLQEVMNPHYLKERTASVNELGELLRNAGVPIVYPTGGHAVFVDAGALLPHIPPTQFPGHALACALYLEAGVRSCEIGSLMFDKAARYGELLRLAIPRRMYSRNHLAYVAQNLIKLARKPENIVGMELISTSPTLRHFTAGLKPIDANISTCCKIS